MPPHYQMAMVQSLLVRSLVAWFWDEPLRAPLIRHGANLHGRYLLPHFIIHDIADVAADLRAHGIDFDTSWLDPFTEFRFPRIGTAVFDGVEIELRGAIEPWNILGEESTAGGTARYVDSSVERLQVRLIGADRHRYVVTANGYPIPLLATDNPDVQVGGVRYRAWQPPSALHPTITVDGPLRFELIDTATGTSRGGCTYHVSHPGGRVLRQPAGQRRRGGIAARTTLRGHRIHAGPGRHVRHSGEAGPSVHRRGRAGHRGSAPGAYRSAVMVLRTSGPPEPIPPSTGVGRAGADDLLASYRAARAQESLFDVRGGAARGYDEFVDAGGQRPAGLAGTRRMRRRARPRRPRPAALGGPQPRRQRRHHLRPGRPAAPRCRPAGDAVTDGDGTQVPGPWHLDALPLLISSADWDTLEAGLVQRSRLLDAVLTDLYGARRSITSGVLPPQLLFAHPGYLRAARGIEIPGRHQLFLHGCDVSRAGSGEFLVNADWTQAPSGAGYALADRRVVAHAIPDLYERIGPRPASPWAQALRLALIDAAPESAEEPVVVVLSPGIHSETAFDQAYLASVLGFPLVESADLVVRDGKLWMRSLGTLKRVDVVLRRVDADYADPLDLRADSRLGVVGLVEVLRRGAVTVVNTLGSGILESPGLLRFLPELAELLLGETPLLRTAPMYWGGIDVERSHLLTHLSSLLIRPVTGGEPIVGPRCRPRSATSWPRASAPPRGSGSARNCRSSPRRPPITAAAGCRRAARACGCSPSRSAAATRR